MLVSGTSGDHGGLPRYSAEFRRNTGWMWCVPWGCACGDGQAKECGGRFSVGGAGSPRPAAAVASARASFVRSARCRAGWLDRMATMARIRRVTGFMLVSRAVRRSCLRWTELDRIGGNSHCDQARALRTGPPALRTGPPAVRLVHLRAGGSTSSGGVCVLAVRCCVGRGGPPAVVSVRSWSTAPPWWPGWQLRLSSSAGAGTACRVAGGGGTTADPSSGGAHRAWLARLGRLGRWCCAWSGPNRPNRANRPGP